MPRLKGLLPRCQLHLNLPRDRSVPFNRSDDRLIGLSAALLIALLCGCGLHEGDAGAQQVEKKPARPTNRLARETSPYLLLHAHNPVDWYPWGPEALEKAKKEGKCIFLSIGYSSCHWCHVMERKVFSDPEIARYMNENFINIKIDREERPDIDDVYMTALQAYFQAIGVNQAGGWPLSLFLTPDARPLGGGTYFPPADEEGRMGFPSLMKKVVLSWTEQRKEMENNAEFLTKAVQSAMRPRPLLQAVKLEKDLVTNVAQLLQGSYDAEHGGFGFDAAQPQRPKFPVPTKLSLLQYAAKRHGDEKAGKMLHHTLDKMAAGGIYDHLAGGFHRYSTDRFWRVPHFEKMLYDNAQLADLYAEAFRQTNDPRYRQVAEGTITFVLRDLTDSATGAFYSALDADTDGIEGKYYVWTREELAAALAPDEAKLIAAVYGTSGEQNFEHGHVLQLTRPLTEVAAELKLTTGQLGARLAPVRQKLLAARQKRSPVRRDDKVLTSWNGLMIRALARAGTALERPAYIDAAAKAANFILVNLRDDQGRLLRTYRAKQAKLNAYLDDYAFLIEGLLALHQATKDEKWANAARRLMEKQLELFWDDKGKGCFFTSHDHEELLARTKNAYDAVLPSGNSVTVRNLVRLASLSKQADFRTRARETLDLFAQTLQDSPGSVTNMALALGEYLDAPEVAAAEKVSGTFSAPDKRPIAGGPAEKVPDTFSASKAPIVLAAATKDEPKKSKDSKTAPAAKETQPPATEKKKSPDLVAGEVYLSVDRLPAGSTCKVLVRLTIAEGWHINTNPAQPDFVIPTVLAAKAKEGTKLKQIRYPAGELLPVPGSTEPQSIYTGHADLLGTLEIPTSAAGKREELTFDIKYQACNDQQCLPSKTLSLKVPVPVAAKGEAVKSINAKLFAPPAKK